MVSRALKPCGLDPEIFTKLEQKWLLHYETTKKIRILSIDGGGTTGIVAGAALIELENQIHLKTSDEHAQTVDFFDEITGTGIGAVLAAMISADDGTGHYFYTAKEAVNVIPQYNFELFKLNKLTGVIHRRKTFSGKRMDKALKEIFKKEDGTVLTLEDTCKPLLVPFFDLNSSTPFVFSRADASESPSHNFELWKVCRAMSATPGFFKLFVLTSTDGKTSCSAVDDGLVMNNPIATVVTHVLHNKRDFPSVNGVENLLILSLRNGSFSSKVRYNGECSTFSVVSIALDGVSKMVDQMFGKRFLLEP